MGGWRAREPFSTIKSVIFFIFSYFYASGFHMASNKFVSPFISIKALSFLFFLIPCIRGFQMASNKVLIALHMHKSVMHISSEAFLDIIAHKIPSYVDSVYGRHPPAIRIASPPSQGICFVLCAIPIPAA